MSSIRASRLAAAMVRSRFSRWRGGDAASGLARGHVALLRGLRLRVAVGGQQRIGIGLAAGAGAQRLGSPPRSAAWWCATRSAGRCARRRAQARPHESQFGGRHDAVDEAPGQRLRRIEGLAVEHQFHRHASARAGGSAAARRPSPAECRSPSPGMEKRASSAAMRRSQAAASSKPPPMQWPCTAASVIAGMASKASIICRPRSVAWRSIAAARIRASRSGRSRRRRRGPRRRAAAHADRAASASQRLAAMISRISAGDSAFSLLRPVQRQVGDAAIDAAAAANSKRGGAASAIIAP